jgi:DNA-binding CsgD family transcriptional regulator
VLRSSLDALQAGVILLDGRNRILAANHSAEEILHKRRGLRSLRGVLACEEASDTSAMHAAVAALTDTTVLDSTRATNISVRRGGGERFLLVQMLPASEIDAVRSIGHKPAVAILYIVDPDSCTTDPANIAEAFRLTAAEARVLREILRCSGLVEAAARLGVSVPTARTHLQHVFEKTDTRSQAELVRLTMMSPLRSRRNV